MAKNIVSLLKKISSNSYRELTHKHAELAMQCRKVSKENAYLKSLLAEQSIRLAKI